ncbi:CD44 antigen isoform X3 [Phascolarctos cinereus]|uniref:CD44 antigen n=1 Tax=Phascolarctos cinereus TaxID=38626 RepID=A0A6P5IKX8_PHACI|nr:CD44 antigen isoform X3 [Phascolarctos cinereus]
MGVPSLMSLLHQNCKQTSETLSLLDRLIRLGRVLRCLCLSGSGWGNSEFVYRERKRTPGQTMDNSWSRTIWGLFLVQLSLAQIELNITCRYAGVYHVEKNGRYSISRTEAADLCKAFNSTLPTLAQMEQALSIGFETCRYGFIDGHVVIPRKTPRFLCAANNTGVYILPSNMSQYDTYCFNASAPLDKEDCSSVTDIPSIFEGQITIGIVNPDGTRYTKKGEYRTNPEDINPSFNPDDDGSSGSAGERSTTGGSTIIQTTYDDVTPTSFQDHESFPSVTSMDSAIISADLEPNEESEEEREKSPSYSGSGIDDDEDFISTTSASTRATSHETIQDWQPWAHGHPNPEEQPQTTAKVTAIVDMNRSDDRAHGENSTQESQPSLVPGEKHEDYDGHSSSTTLDIPSNTTQETAVQQQGWEWFLNHPQPPNEDAEPTAETTAQDTYSRQETTSQRQDDSWIGYLDPISHPVEHYNPTGRNMDGKHTETSTHDPMGGGTSFFSDFNEELPLSPPSTPMSTVTSGVTEVIFPGGFDSRNEKFQTDTAPHHSTADPKEGWLEDKGTTHYPPMATAEHNHPQSTSRPHTGLEDGHKHSPAPSPTSLTDGDDGLEYGSLPEDSTTPVEDSFIHFPGKNENTAHSSVTPVTTGLPGVTKPTVSESFIPDNTRVPSDHDDSRAGQPRWPAVTAYSTPVPDGNQGQSEQNPNLKRKPKIPEWLIILSALLALALILAVCIAVNSRRRCGQKKKLVINNGNGAVDDKKTPGLNGDASKSQEMVHLVNKEPFDNQMGQDECMTADETRNLQNVDMKIGV